MSKTIPIALNNHYAEQSTKLAILVKITRRDGDVFGFTSHDRPLVYDGLTYVSSNAAPSMSDIRRSAGLEPANAEVDGAFNDDLTEDDTEAELWSGAAVQVYRGNWSNLTGVELLATGELGQITHDGRRYKTEMFGRAHKLGRVISRHYLPSCDADFGDARCGVDIEAIAVNLTVTSVTSNREFATDLGSPAQDDYFTYGRVTWLTGLNAERQMEVKESTEAGVFILQLGMKRAITASDTLRAYPGCNKTFEDCQRHNNTVNFRGFKDIPGIDKILRPAGT